MSRIVRCAVLVFFLAALPLAAQTGAWSAVGSTGAIFDTSLGNYAFNGPALQHRAATTGTILANYNVTNTFGGGFTDAPAWSRLELTWFDNSPSSAIAAVLFKVDRCTGVTTVLCNVSSIDNPAVTCNACGFPVGAINFGTSLYFVQVRMARSVTTVTPRVIGLRIF